MGSQVASEAWICFRQVVQRRIDGKKESRSLPNNDGTNGQQIYDGTIGHAPIYAPRKKSNDKYGLTLPKCKTAYIGDEVDGNNQVKNGQNSVSGEVNLYRLPGGAFLFFSF